MSHDATRWAWGQKLDKGTTKYVLLALADRAKDGVCYPSMARLRDDTQLNDRTLVSAIRYLEEHGYVSVLRDPGRVPVYTLNLSRSSDEPPCKSAPPVKVHPLQECTPTPCKSAPPPPVKVHPEPVIEPVTEPVTKSVAHARATRPRKTANCPWPEALCITPAIQAWASKAGYLEDLSVHLDHLRDKAERRGYEYAGIKGWTLTLQKAIREDWAGVRTSKRTTRAGPARASPNDSLRQRRGLGKDESVIEGECTHDDRNQKTRSDASGLRGCLWAGADG